MALSSYELERIADDMYKDRVIRGSVYCGHCGYNLHSLPYVYTCPECGNQYNARPLKMDGIFVLHDTYFPASDVAAVLLCAPIVYLLIAGGVNPTDYGRLILGAGVGVVALTFAVKAYHRLPRFFKARSIARRIALEEQEEE